MVDFEQPYAMPPGPNSSYGIQRRVSHLAGAAKPAQLLEAGKTELLWRITAWATNGLFTLSWGTYGTNGLVRLRSPLSITIPGAFSLQVLPINPALALDAVAALSVASGGVSVARRIVTALGDLGPIASRVTALAASTVTVDGTAVVLVAGASVDVCAPSALTAGGPLLVDHAL